MKNRYDLDYETRSALDIKAVGAFAYIEHFLARILLAAVSKNGGPVFIWDCFASDEENAPALAIIKEMMSDPDAEIWAHNVMFEIAATNARLFKDLGIWPCTLDKWRCTAALCRVAGFPSSLENASNALFPGTTQVKDTKGKDLIKAFCCPQDDGSFLNPYALTTPVWTAKRLTAAQPELPADLFEAIAAKAPETDKLQLVDGAFEGPKRPTIARLRQVLTKAESYVADATAHLAGVKVGGELVPHAKAWQMFREYCMQDVKVQAAIWKKLSPEFAPKGWMLDSFTANLDIGVRGIPVNLSAVNNALSILETNATDLLADFAALTGGLAPSQRDKFLQWAQARGYKGTDMTAATVDDELVRLEAEDAESDVFKALTLRSKLSFAALAKLPKMIDMASGSGRVRNGFTWCGARTGRDTAAGLQPQNFRRPGRGSDEVYAAICSGFTRDELVSCGMWENIPAMLDPHEAVASCIRHFLQEPDRDMTSIDFSNIEARIAPWLVGQKDKLQMYYDGVDVYCAIAAGLGIFNRTYDELFKQYKAGDKDAADMRQVGKVAELACQFMGGEDAVATFAKIYRVKLTPEQCRLVKTKYRAANPETVKAWRMLGECAIAAVTTPGSVHTHMRVSFQATNFSGIPYLTMILPSGRKLYYPKPRIVWMRMRFQNGKKTGKPQIIDHEPGPDEIEMLRTLNPADRKIVDSEAAMASARGEDYRPSIYYMVKPQLVFWGEVGNNTWGDVATHGGKLLENAVQGTAACFFHYAVPRLIKAGFRITMTVHDEVVGPVDPGHDAKKLEALMAENPPWALDFPLAAKASTDRYYTK